jgi:hypothetical protein
MQSQRNSQVKNQKIITMKKLLLLPLFLIGAMTASKAQTGAPVTSGMENKNGPIMTMDVLEYNFGTIKQGDIVTREYKFKNTGKEPLIINNAVGSCGCTVPDYPKEPIKPNGTGVIKVTFNSAGKMGQQDKTVTLTYDTDKTIVLHLKGTVEAPSAQPAPQAPVVAPQNGGTTGNTKTQTTQPAVQSTTPSTPAPADKPKN